MHCAGGALPQIGAGSPRSSSSPALSFGNAANNCSNDGHKQQQQMNGRAAQQQQRESQREQQQQQRAAAGHGAGSSLRSSGAAAAAAAGGGEGQPVFRSQYRGVSYDKKKRKWRVQIKVAALGKSGGRLAGYICIHVSLWRILATRSGLQIAVVALALV
jgi:hypothetical protein